MRNKTGSEIIRTITSRWHFPSFVYLADLYRERVFENMTSHIIHKVFVPAVLVRRGPDNKAELVLLDHGLYEYLSER